MMRRYIVHRNKGGIRRVSDRATRRILGTVGQHWGNSFAGCWSAWGPFDDGTDGAVGEISLTMHEAIEDLLEPANHQPVVSRLVCREHCNTIPMPVARINACDACESHADALTRSRREHPDWWEHFDWLQSLRETT